jgi:hypothetical protein
MCQPDPCERLNKLKSHWIAACAGTTMGYAFPTGLNTRSILPNPLCSKQAAIAATAADTIVLPVD